MLKKPSSKSFVLSSFCPVQLLYHAINLLSAPTQISCTQKTDLNIRLKIRQYHIDIVAHKSGCIRQQNAHRLLGLPAKILRFYVDRIGNVVAFQWIGSAVYAAAAIGELIRLPQDFNVEIEKKQQQ